MSDNGKGYKIKTREIPMTLILSGETLKDYEIDSDADIIKAFIQFYNVDRKDFKVKI
jgi:hypothetical protein